MKIEYYYLNKFFFFLTPIALIILLYFYGNNPEYFDYIYIGALVFSGLFCWHEKDSFGAVIVLLGYNCLSKLVFKAPDEAFFWVVAYIISLGIAAYYIDLLASKILLAIVMFTIGAELYWYMVEYSAKPMMSYWIALLSLTLWLKQILNNRIFLMDELFGYTGGKLALDGHIGSVLNAYYLLIVLMIVEFYIRHLAGLKNALVVYNYFTPVTTFLSAVILAAVYMHYFYNQSQKHLSV